MELRFKIKDIPYDGTPLQVHQAVSRELVATVFEGTDGNVANTHVNLDMQLMREHDNVIARGRLVGSFEVPCGRCVDPANIPLHLTFDAVFSRQGGSDVLGEDESVDSPDEYLHDGSTVSLENPVREMLIAELPIAPLCGPGCLGLCTVCGANRNTEEGQACGHTQADPLAETKTGLAAALADAKLRS